MFEDCPTQAGTACCIFTFILYFVWLALRLLGHRFCSAKAHLTRVRYVVSCGWVDAFSQQAYTPAMKEVKPRIVRAYTTPDGRKPFREWLTSLKDKRAQAEIYTRIERVELGNFGDCKRGISGRVGELRTGYFLRHSF